MRPVIGYNYGAGEKERVKKIYRLTLYMTGSIMILGTILCLLASGQLIGFFTTNSETIRIGQAAWILCRIGDAEWVWHAFWISETITALIAWRIYHKSVKMN